MHSMAEAPGWCHSEAALLAVRASGSQASTDCTKQSGSARASVNELPSSLALTTKPGTLTSLHGHQRGTADKDLSGKSQHSKRKRKRIDWTHFLSVPLRSAEDQQNFMHLKTAILEQLPGAVPEAAFISKAKFHITLCLLQLRTDEAMAKAVEVINECRPAIRGKLHQAGSVKDNKLLVLFAPGLMTFPDCDASKAQVIFRNPAPGSEARYALQDVAKMCISDFEKAGVTCSSQAEIALHATVINVRYASTKKRLGAPIDARPVLNTFSAWPACTCTTPDLHLSAMAAPAPDGYYPCALKIPVVDHVGNDG
jgi:hypothetical protein